MEALMWYLFWFDQWALPISELEILKAKSHGVWELNLLTYQPEEKHSTHSVTTPEPRHCPTHKA